VNTWKYKSVETRPDGAQTITYSNYAGQPMLEVLKSGQDEWITYTRYNSSGQVVLQANPSAVSGYSEQHADLVNFSGGSAQYLRDDEGLIRVYEYDSASGRISAEKIKHGEQGAEIKLREYEYVAHYPDWDCSSSSSSSSSSGAAATPVFFLSKEIVYPSDTDQTKKITTSYSYTFHPCTAQVKERVTTLPAVPTEQNGSGVSATRRDYFDIYGNLTWQMDERGYITRTKYDLRTGAVTQTIQDVDTSQVADEPSGWSTPADGGKHLVTDYEHDDLGRITQTLGPAHTIDIDGVATSIRRASWTVYDDVNSEVRSAQGYATGAEWDTFTLVNPVSITKSDKAGKVLEEIQAVRASTSGKLLASDTFAQSSYVRWSTTQYSDCCHESSRRVYHAIPASGEGDEGTNYDQSVFGQDSLGRQNRTVSPGGTITRTVFDARGQAVKIYVGTDDTGATESDPTGGGATGNNMVLVTEYEYDGGAAGGDGLLTKETQHVSASETRVTEYLTTGAAGRPTSTARSTSTRRRTSTISTGPRVSSATTRSIPASRQAPRPAPAARPRAWGTSSPGATRSTTTWGGCIRPSGTR
jgi:hypothetical protein